jgi:hypothetical protein
MKKNHNQKGKSQLKRQVRKISERMVKTNRLKKQSSYGRG